MQDHNTFMELAIQNGKKALYAGEFPVGCVLVYNNEILVTGERSGTTNGRKNEIDHAEITALKRYLNLNRDLDPARITMYCNLEPCLMCYAAAILHGLGKIVYSYEDVMGGGTQCDLSALSPLYANSEIALESGVLRQKSLKLFKDFFSNPKNDYWKDSLLAAYTLSQ
jgi:tRNA(adenine34) deaminase